MILRIKKKCSMSYGVIRILFIFSTSFWLSLAERIVILKYLSSKPMNVQQSRISMRSLASCSFSLVDVSFPLVIFTSKKLVTDG